MGPESDQIIISPALDELPQFPNTVCIPLKTGSMYQDQSGFNRCALCKCAHGCSFPVCHHCYDHVDPRGSDVLLAALHTHVWITENSSVSATGESRVCVCVCEKEGGERNRGMFTDFEACDLHTCLHVCLCACVYVLVRMCTCVCLHFGVSLSRPADPERDGPVHRLLLPGPGRDTEAPGTRGACRGQHLLRMVHGSGLALLRPGDPLRSTAAHSGT